MTTSSLEDCRHSLPHCASVLVNVRKRNILPDGFDCCDEAFGGHRRVGKESEAFLEFVQCGFYGTEVRRGRGMREGLDAVLCE